MRRVLCGILLVLPILLAALPERSHAQAVSVTPNCGTNGTHFIVSGGGLPGPTKACPDSCHLPADVFLDGQFIYTLAGCATGFTIDLQKVPGRPQGQECVACGLIPGNHVVKFSSTNLECTGDPGPRQPLCVQAAFQIVGSAANGDPWNSAFSLSSDGQFITLNFSSCAICDVPPCDSILFIQVIRPLAQDALGNRTKYTYVQQGWTDGPSRDSTLTDAGYRVDVGPTERVPYYIGTYQGTAVPIVRIGTKDGSCGAAAMMDNPSRPASAYQPGVAAIVLEYEVNVFCAAGDGRGHWLGRCTWTWQQPSLGGDSISFGTCDRSLPSAEFRDALDLWSFRREFSLPSPIVPTSGGVACN